jgi:hypothetical protein
MRQLALRLLASAAFRRQTAEIKFIPSLLAIFGIDVVIAYVNVNVTQQSFYLWWVDVVKQIREVETLWG